jgi:hypothetical protein
MLKRSQGWLARLEIRDDGEHSPMVVFAPGEVKLHEDAAHVLLDGAFGDVEAMRDAIVGASFRHEGEHLTFPRRQLGQWIVAPARADESLDERGIENRAAVSYALDRLEEVAGSHHPALQQVADPLPALEQVHRRLDLDMSRKQENPDLRELGPNRARRLEALGRIRRWHPNVDHDKIWAPLAHQVRQPECVPGLAHDVVSGAVQEACDSFAQEDVVVGQDHASSGHVG